jgi:hypothetical protein
MDKIVSPGPSGQTSCLCWKQSGFHFWPFFGAGAFLRLQCGRYLFPDLSKRTTFSCCYLASFEVSGQLFYPHGNFVFDVVSFLPQYKRYIHTWC